MVVALALAVTGCGRVGYLLGLGEAVDSGTDVAALVDESPLGGAVDALVPVSVELGAAIDASADLPMDAAIAGAVDLRADLLASVDASIMSDMIARADLAATPDLASPADATAAPADLSIGAPPDFVRFTLLPPRGVYAPGATLAFTARFAAPVSVSQSTANLVFQTSTGPTSVAISGGKGTELTFTYTVQAADTGTGGIEVGSFSGSVVGPGGAVGSLAFPPIPLPGVLVNPVDHCPTNYSLVPGDPLYAPQDFCIAQFEARATASLITPTGVVIGNVLRDDANAQCMALGAGYSLPSNEQWQMVARDIELTTENWSGWQMTAPSALNVGNYDIEQGDVDVTNPCATPGFGVRFPNCTNHASSDFARKRSHVLSNGALVWDLAGNASEWVSGPVPAGAANSSSCSLPSMLVKTFGPARSYDASNCGIYTNNGTWPQLYGLGVLEGSGSDRIWRGFSSGTSGSPWNNCNGVFYANVNSYYGSDAHTSPSLGFRCAYQPPSWTSSTLAIVPSRINLPVGAAVTFVARGGIGPYTMTDIAREPPVVIQAGVPHTLPAGSTGEVVDLVDATGSHSVAIVTVLPL